MSYLDDLPKCPTCGNTLRTRDNQPHCPTCQDPT